MGNVFSAVLIVEAAAILSMQDKLSDGSLAKAVKLILHTRARVVVTGMGKSGKFP